MYKFVFPSLWISGFGSGTLAIIRANEIDAIAFVICFIAGTLAIYWGCIRLKRVSMDGEYLYVSNYLTEIKVRRSEICKVTENVFVNIHPVWIHFRRTTDFGDYIMFMPRARLFAFFSSHPIVAELRRKVDAGCRPDIAQGHGNVR